MDYLKAKLRKSIINFEILFLLFFFLYFIIKLKNQEILSNNFRYISENWVVITTTDPPNSDFEQFIKEANQFKIVIIGDLKTDDRVWKNYKYSDKLIYLSVKNQLKLGYKILNYIPFNSYSRKNIGYLYAIQHGAKRIYETDMNFKNYDLNCFHTNLEQIAYFQNNPSKMINPYSYFSRTDIWPRGFKIKDIAKNDNKFFLSTSFVNNVKPMIFQGIINGNPDLDSIFISTRIKQGNKNLFIFNALPPLIYFPGNYVPISSKNTIFMYEAFPAAVLPISKNERVSDIIRGYIMQRYAWIYNATVAFRYSSLFNHNIDFNYNKERILFSELDDLLNILNLDIYQNVRSPFEFLIKIIINLVKAKILTQDDLKIYKAYLRDLIDFGFLPKISINTKINNNLIYFNNYSQFHFIPILTNDYLFKDINHILYDDKRNINFYHLSKINKYKNVLLMINYNYGYLVKYNQFIKDLYQCYFENIIFISPEKELNNNKNSSEDIIYCPETSNGYYSYFCITKVYKKKPNMDGYLFLMDDVLLKVPELNNFNLSIPWRTNYDYGCEFHDWWKIYANRTILLYENHKEWKLNLTKFHGENKMPCGLSDFYYIPKYLMDRFCLLAIEFYKYKIFLEIAVPNIFSILVEANYQYIFFSGLWGTKRNYVINYLKSVNGVAVHPIKFSNDNYKKETWNYFILNNLFNSYLKNI